MKITRANVSIEKALADKITQRVIYSKWTARWYTESMVDVEVVDNIKEMDEIMRRRSSHLELYHWTPEWEKVWSWLSAHFFLLLACILTIFYKKYHILTCRNKRDSYLIVLKQLGMLKM